MKSRHHAGTIFGLLLIGAAIAACNGHSTPLGIGAQSTASSSRSANPGWCYGPGCPAVNKPGGVLFKNGSTETVYRGAYTANGCPWTLGPPGGVYGTPPPSMVSSYESPHFGLYYSFCSDVKRAAYQNGVPPNEFVARWQATYGTDITNPATECTGWVNLYFTNTTFGGYSWLSPVTQGTGTNCYWDDDTFVYSTTGPSRNHDTHYTR
jgi:hypothetical protein